MPSLIHSYLYHVLNKLNDAWHIICYRYNKFTIVIVKFVIIIIVLSGFLLAQSRNG